MARPPSIPVTPAAELPPGAITVVHAAAYLEVSKGTIHNMVRDGRLPAIKIGYSLRIPLWALEQLVGVPYPKRLSDITQEAS